MNKLREKLRIGVIACLAAFAVSTVFASCEKKPDNPDNPDNPTGGETVVSDTFNIYVFGKESWTPFAGKSGVSFSNSDNNVLSITDNGTKVEFTGKQVGNSTITATLGDETKKALVKVRAAQGDETHTVYFDKIGSHSAPNIEGNRSTHIEINLRGTGIGDIEKEDIIITPQGVLTGRLVLQSNFYEDENEYLLTLYFDGVSRTETLTVKFQKAGYTFIPSSKQVQVNSN